MAAKTFAKRNYKKTAIKRSAPAPAPADEPQDAPAPVRSGFSGRPAGGGRGFGRSGSGGGDRGYGGGRRGGGNRSGGQQNAEFMRITGLFPAASGKGFHALVKPDILENLQQVQKGDYIGVSYSRTKDGQDIMTLWASRAK